MNTNELTMHRLPFTQKALARSFVANHGDVECLQSEVMERNDKKAELQGYLDAYVTHQRIMEVISLYEPLRVDRLVPSLAAQSLAYREGFKAFICLETLPMIRLRFHEAGRSQNECHQVLDRILRKLAKQ